MPLLMHHGVVPTVGASVFVADGAMVFGDVRLGDAASVWFNAVLRGDINRIDIGARTNVQDGSVVHVTHELPVIVGSDVTIGHLAMVHGCRIHDRCLIGMNAVVLDGAEVGPDAVVAAGAVVREQFRVPAGVLVAGVPARIVRELTVDERTALVRSAEHYVEYAATFARPAHRPEIQREA